MKVLHVDANSAYLSWTAVHLLESGYPVDLRTVPAVIAGNPESRHGIILAKSLAAKKMGVRTGETLAAAREKCASLQVHLPEYDLYVDCSDAMYKILSDYSDRVERYSIDECFLEYNGNSLQAEKAAEEIRKRIYAELGFTVSIGVSNNKVLAKMAGELKKPDAVSTLYPWEIKEKLWPLSVSDLFMVGPATTAKLEKINIRTVGQLACCDVSLLRSLMKSHGQKVWEYANGIDNAPVAPNREVLQKGLGNSCTFAYDLQGQEEVYAMLLALCERVGLRLRRHRRRAGLVSLFVGTGSFLFYHHQKKLEASCSSTDDIFKAACQLLKQCWRGEAVRRMGVRVGELLWEDEVQMDFLTGEERERREALERAADQVRLRFGEKALMRGCFANTGIEPLQGGVNEGNFIGMGGYRG